MAFKPVSPKSRVYMEIVEQIKEQIKIGHLKAGSPLPSEREMAEKFEVSRSSVREAITILGSLGIIEVQHGKGSFVRDFQNTKSMENYFDTFALLFDIEPAQTLQLLQVRKILEPHAAALAAKNATPEDVLRLNEIQKEMKITLDRGEVSLNPDYNFHFHIAASTGNDILLSTLRALSDIMRRSLRQTSWLSLTNKQRTTDPIIEHEQIIEAIDNKDAEIAYQIMFKHLEEVEINFKKSLKEEIW